MSSKVVPSVMYEPLADELRLCGGDGRLSKLSEPFALEMKSSPVPLSRLGEPVPAGIDCRARVP